MYTKNKMYIQNTKKIDGIYAELTISVRYINIKKITNSSACACPTLRELTLARF